MANFKGITLPDGTTYFPEGSGSAIDTVSVSVDNNTGVPSATGSVSNGVLTLDFQNIKGEQGPQGKQGPQGPAGATGATPNIQIGDVTTLQPDQQATASITGTSENPLLNLGIPQGQAGGEGEWQLFQTITGDGETFSFEWNSLDFNEFIFICKGLTNASEVNSSLRIFINGAEISLISTQGSNSPSENKYQFAHFKYNGLCWQQQVMPQANNESGYYVTLANVRAPYAYNLEVGKCTSLIIKAPINTYILTSGTIQIYAR